jgi:CBS-domain-containing membrane protein
MLGGFVIVAALGASTFIVFAMPSSATAEPRRLIGEHAVGLFSGALCYLVFLSGSFEQLITNYEFILILTGAL